MRIYLLKIHTSVVIFATCLCFLASCSNTVLLADGSKVERPKKKVVMQHLEQRNVEELIYDHTCQSKQNEEIYNFLQLQSSYGKVSYAQLNRYAAKKPE